jgi:hypothetical protein
MSVPYGYEPFHDILANLHGLSFSTNGRGYALCPAHDDRRRLSLTLGIGKGGQLLVRCHANKGCTFKSIAAALGFPESRFYLHPVEAHTGPDVVATRYVYRDRMAPRFRIVRTVLKAMWVERWEAGEWIKGLADYEPIPYQLDSLRACPSGEPVFFVEGEKKADCIREVGLVATCSPFGAGKFSANLAGHFKGLQVVILPDHDEAGWKHAGMVATALAPLCCVRICELPLLRLKGDVWDWFQPIAIDARREALLAAAANARIWDGTDAQERLAVLRMEIARALCLSCLV